MTCNKCRGEQSSSSARVVLNNPWPSTHRFSRYPTSNLQYTALPPHFHGSELPLYNTSERRRIQYPNSSTISETRAHPTVCDCGEICLLVFYCHVIISALITQSIKGSINVSNRSKCLYVNAFICMFSSFIAAAWLSHWLDDWCFSVLNT